MVKQNFFTCMLCIVSILMIAGLWGCQGPTGPAGQNSADLEGFAPGIVCGNCHNQDYNSNYAVLAKQMEYEVSDHGEGADYTRNTTQCAGCHTNEGFLERYNNGFKNETFSINTSSGPMVTQNYPASTRPGCFTCHMPHSRGNFTVRDSGAVNIFTLVATQSTKIWNSTPSSNLCVKCHQPRMTSTFLTATPYSWQPDPTKTNTTDTATIYTTRWNNHVSGEMAQTLLGFGGVELTGTATYSNSEHTVYHNGNPVGCEECHMATVNGVIQNGGHTFAVKDTSDYSKTPAYNVNGCNVNGCHTGLTASASDGDWGKRTTIITELNQLGKMMMDTNVTKLYSLPQSGKAVPWVTYTVTGIDTAWAQVNATSSKPLVIVPAAKAGALWNLQQVYYDKSHGVHNYRYTKALLDNSIYQLSH